MKRWALALFLLAACKAAPAEHDEAETVTVKCVAGDRRDMTETVTLRGRVAAPPGGDLAIAAQVSGRLTSVEVREGQKLAAGDVVATVDDAPSRDTVRQAEAALAQVQANESNARATLDRVKALVAKGIAAKQELDDAQTRLDALHADANAARASADLARRTLGRVVVRTAFAGVVTRVLRGPGALVDGTAATPIAQIASSQVVEFVADATVKDLSRVDAGQTTQTTLLTGAAVPGTVIARSSALDPATGLGTVRIALDSARADVPLGTFGTTVINGPVRTGVLTFPASVLRGAVADGAEIVVCAGGKAEVRRVEVGFRSGDRVELRGVDEKEHLAADHVLGLETGQGIAEAP